MFKTKFDKYFSYRVETAINETPYVGHQNRLLYNKTPKARQVVETKGTTKIPITRLKYRDLTRTKTKPSRDSEIHGPLDELLTSLDGIVLATVFLFCGLFKSSKTRLSFSRFTCSNAIVKSEVLKRGHSKRARMGILCGRFKMGAKSLFFYLLYMLLLYGWLHLDLG